MAYLFCATFVFSTTRISALTVHRLQRDGFTGEGSASGFASVKSMGMLLFAAVKRGTSPYLTVLKCYKTADLISNWSLQACPEAACSPPPVMFCGGLWGPYKVRAGFLQGASFPGVTCGAWSNFPYFLPPLLPGCSIFTWLLKMVIPLGLVSAKLPSRWNSEDCKAWCKLPAQLPSMFLCLSLAPFLTFSARIQIHSQFWLLSWYLAVTVLHTGAPNQFLLHKYISLSTPSKHDPFHKLQCLFSNPFPFPVLQLLGLTQNCTYPSPPNRHKPNALSLPSCLWSFSRFLTLSTLYTFFALCWWTFALKGKEDLSLCMKHQGCSEESLSQTFIPVQRKWDVISLSEMRKAAFLRPPDGLTGVRAYDTSCTEL